MNEDINASIEKLIKAYALHLPNKVAEITAAWDKYKESFDAITLQDLLIKSHTLCGSSGTYGYKLISQLCRDLEHRFYDLQQSKNNNLAEIDDLIRDLNQLSVSSSPDKLMDPTIFRAENYDKHTVLILDSDPKSKNLFDEFRQFDYQIEFFENSEAFVAAVRKNRPGLVIINIDLIESIPPKIFQEFKEDLILVTFMGATDDLNTRLLTVRNNGQAFITKPFEVNTMLRTIDNLFEARKLQNEKVLIVDDSTFIANYFSMLLNQVGMLTQLVTDPKEFLSSLLEFQPDLILMDINMPFCTGTELAQIVQQQENLNGIPIIFLSSIAEKNKQLEVMSFAGDDFLVKPVDPKFLIAAVRNRLMRSRMVRFRIMRDSLTNLYNHTMIHHQLERELLIAERYQKSLSVVLIDLDHFKNVNDKYGHQAGDKILKDLSVFLKKSLRKSDSVGRYGGEEFLIILPNTDEQNAIQVIEILRENFSSIAHTFNEQIIFVTLSAGIATYPKYDSAATLIKLADKALYKAKELGRNKVIPA